MNMCPLCSRSLKTGVKGEQKKRNAEEEQRQEELKLEEIWIHISSLIHAAKQSQSWTESKRISTGEPQGSYQMENPAGQPGVTPRGFQHSEQTSALLLSV